MEFLSFFSDVTWEPILAIGLFIAVIAVLMLGVPVAMALAGTALIFAGIGLSMDAFDGDFLHAFPSRVYSTLINFTLLAVPLFVFMGVMLEKSKIAEELLTTMADVFRNLRAGMLLSVIAVGGILAASTGIVGATVVTMGLLSLPALLRQGTHPAIATGTIASAGTLGQIIPPSIILVILGDVLSSAYQQAQLALGNYSPKTLSVGDLFAGALIPGLMLVVLYMLFVWVYSLTHPHKVAIDHEKPEHRVPLMRVLVVIAAPVMLMLAVLGSILSGAATPTEAAAVGAVGAMLLAALRKQLTWENLKSAGESTLRITSMVYFILLGAAMFSLVFRGFEGDELITEFLTQLPGGEITALLVVFAVMFLLGFVLDFIEITFVVVPIIGPVLMMMGYDPVWLGIMIALVLQTSFLTPPFGFSLFYLRGVAPAEVKTTDLYKGVIPFVALQILLMFVLYFVPELATWLPMQIYGE